MRLIDAQFLETPWYGSRQMSRHLRRNGHEVGRKRVRRLMAVMGLVPIYLHAFETGSELRAGLLRWIGYYNTPAPPLHIRRAHT